MSGCVILTHEGAAGVSTRARFDTLSSMAVPLAYFITWTCRGTWLHGDGRGSVDREHNAYGTAMIPPDATMYAKSAARLKQDSLELTAADRLLVAGAIKATCSHRGWTIHALAVRSNHVHSVVSADATPERVMHDLKAWSTRALRQSNHDFDNRPIWTRHGSTRYLFDEPALHGAIEYVVSHETHPRAHASGSF